MSKIHEKCKGCLKLNRAGECMAFIDVKYQHERNGGCYGRVDKAEDMAKMYEDMAKYTKSEQESKRIFKEAERWRKRQHGQA